MNKEKIIKMIKQQLEIYEKLLTEAKKERDENLNNKANSYIYNCRVIYSDGRVDALQDLLKKIKQELGE